MCFSISRISPKRANGFPIGKITENSWHGVFEMKHPIEEIVPSLTLGMVGGLGTGIHLDSLLVANDIFGIPQFSRGPNGFNL